MINDLYAALQDLLDSGRTDPGVNAEARALTTQIIHAGTEPPSPPLPVAYGSPAWRALTDSDPRKREAIVDAAESWLALVHSPYATEILSAYYEWDHRRVISEWSGDVAEQNDHTPGPSYRELEQRRAIPGPMAAEFTERHGSEYHGGPVDWTTGRTDDEAAA